MSKISDQFQGLPMQSLIGGPLQAACDAQVLLAKASADFIRNVGLQEKSVADKDKKTTTKSLEARTVDFSFTKPVQVSKPDPNDKTGKTLINTVEQQKVDLQVPLLAILNTPSLSVKEVDVQFTMEVKEAISDHSSTDKEGTLDAEAKVGWGPFSLDVKVHGSVSSKSEHTRTSDNSAKYDVKVIARDDGMPEGLSRVLDMLNSAIAPVASTGSTD